MSGKKRKSSTCDHRDANIVQTPAEASEIVKELLSVGRKRKGYSSL
jgi:hypothetical protein